MRTSSGADLAGLDPPRVGLGVVDDHAGVAQRLHGHGDVGFARHRLAVVVDGDALVVAGAGQQQGRDELRRGGGVERDRAAADRAGPVDDDREGAAATVVQRDPEGAQGVEDRAHRPHPRLRVAVELDPAVGERGDRRQEPHDRAGQPDVDADAAATASAGAGPPSPRPPGTSCTGIPAPWWPSAGTSSISTPSAREAGGHQQGVAGAERLAEPRPVAGQRGEDEEPVGERLAAGQRDRGLDGPPRGRGGPVAGMAGVAGGGGGGHVTVARPASARARPGP